MAARLMHRDGSHSNLTEESQIDALLRELNISADEEHPEIAVTHESEWRVGASAGTGCENS